MAARLFLPWGNPIVDANGATISGAMVNVFANETDNPVTTYTDIDLATPLPTNVTADGGGRLPGIYVPDHLYFRVRLLDGDGVQLDQQDNCPSLGEDWTQESRDFTTNGRWRIYGSDGNPVMEFGPPAGTDTGGTGTIGGWAGTPLDALHLDAKAVDFDGKTLSLVGLTSGSVTSAATLELDLPTDNKRYRLELSAIMPSVNGATLAFQIQRAGESYLTTQYVTTFSSMTQVSSFQFTPALADHANGSGPGLVELEINTGAAITGVSGFVMNWNGSSGVLDNYAASGFQGAGGTAVKIKIFPSSGTIDLTYKLFVYADT